MLSGGRGMFDPVDRPRGVAKPRGMSGRGYSIDDDLDNLDEMDELDQDETHGVSDVRGWGELCEGGGVNDVRGVG